VMRSSEAYLHGGMAQLGSGVIAGHRHVGRVSMRRSNIRHGPINHVSW
jgi:hypothetical protein